MNISYVRLKLKQTTWSSEGVQSVTKNKTDKSPPMLGFVAVVVTAHGNIDFDVNLHAFKYRPFLHF